MSPLVAALDITEAKILTVALEAIENMFKAFKKGHQESESLRMYRARLKELDGEDIRRSYSVSSYHSLDDQLQISCKMIEGGKMSTYLFKELGVGDNLEIMPPDGNFRLQETTNALVLFANYILFIDFFFFFW